MGFKISASKICFLSLSSAFYDIIVDGYFVVRIGGYGFKYLIFGGILDGNGGILIKWELVFHGWTCVGFKILLSWGIVWLDVDSSLCGFRS